MFKKLQQTFFTTVLMLTFIEFTVQTDLYGNLKLFKFNAFSIVWVNKSVIYPNQSDQVNEVNLGSKNNDFT